jgi:hypothetical protein
MYLNFSEKFKPILEKMCAANLIVTTVRTRNITQHDTELHSHSTLFEIPALNGSFGREIRIQQDTQPNWLHIILM